MAVGTLGFRVLYIAGLIASVSAEPPSCLVNSSAEPVLREAFALLDVNGEGGLSPADVANASFLGINLSQVFPAADGDEDGSVNLSEFQSAACSLQHRLSVELTAVSGGEETDAERSPQPDQSSSQPSLRGSRAQPVGRAEALRALESALAIRTSAGEGDASRTTTLGRSLVWKVLWDPSKRCEKYIMLTCGDMNGWRHRSCPRSRNAVCDEVNHDCVCPPGKCSDLNGVCMPCDAEQRGAEYCNATASDEWQTLCNGRNDRDDPNCPQIR